MVRVLNIVECMQAAGIESYIMNVYRNLDRDKIQFDFWVTRNQEEFYDKEIKKLGGRKFTTDRLNEKNTLIRILKESKDLYNFLVKNHYDIIQVHTGTPLRVFYLIAAKKAGVKMRIYHSHSAEVYGPHKGLALKKKIFGVLKKLIPHNATHLFACSKAAAKWMYPLKVQDKVKIINNGIILEKFIYNEDIRKKYREEFGVNDKIVIGHVARFNNQKNHKFLIDLMNQLSKETSQYVLWLIGTGELKNEIKNKVNELHLEKLVNFLGVRDDVNKLMQAMDIFVLPSNYEGLPVVGIEAQAAGLEVLFSKNITEEVKIIPNAKFLKLDINEWKNEIINFIPQSRDTQKYVIEKEYRIEDTVKKLSYIYTKE